MSEIPPPVPSGPAESCECPICLRPAKPWKCKTLYGVKVCTKCRNGLANRRQAAYIVDAVLFTVLEQVILISLARAYVMGSPAAAEIVDAVVLILGWLAFPFLFSFKDAFNGRSPGKMLFKVRVVDVQTRQPISAWQSMKRNLVLMIPYVGLIGGVITMMGGQRWGDKWAGTMVIWNKYAFRVPFAPDGRFCRSCGYDLTGNTSGVCPECGLQIAAGAGNAGAGTSVVA